MMKYCLTFAKGCEQFQKHVPIQHVLADELHSIIKPLPLRGWALDLIGQINPTSSKWVEVVPLKKVDQPDFINFIEDNIICRFGIPQTLTAEKKRCSLEPKCESLQSLEI